MEKILRTNKETGVEYWIHFTPETIELLKDKFFNEEDAYINFLIETEEQSKKYNQPIGTYMFELTTEQANLLTTKVKQEFKRGSIVTFKERVYEAPEQYKGMSVEDILKEISIEELKKVSFTKEVDVCGIIIKSIDGQSLVWYFDGKEIQGIILKEDEMTACADDAEFKF